MKTWYSNESIRGVMMRCYIDREDAEVGYGVILVFISGQGYLLGKVEVGIFAYWQYFRFDGSSLFG